MGKRLEKGFLEGFIYGVTYPIQDSGQLHYAKKGVTKGFRDLGSFEGIERRRVLGALMGNAINLGLHYITFSSVREDKETTNYQTS